MDDQKAIRAFKALNYKINKNIHQINLLKGKTYHQKVKIENLEGKLENLFRINSN